MKQTTKFLHIVMCMVLGLSVSMTSCKDYDDDIDGLNQRVDALEKSLSELSTDFGELAYVKSVSFADGVLTVTPATGSDVKYTIPDEDTNTTYSLEVKSDDQKVTITMTGSDGSKNDFSFDLPQSESFNGQALTVDENGYICYNGIPTLVKLPEATTGFDESKLVLNKEDNYVYYDGEKTGVQLDKFNPALLTVEGNKVLYAGDETEVELPVVPTLDIKEITDGTGTIIGYAITYDGKTTNLKVVPEKLQGLVFIPQFYYQGIEAMGVNTIEYKALEDMMEGNANGYEKGYIEPTEGALASVAPKFNASYHLNPSNVSADLLKVENMSFLAKDLAYTKAGTVVPDIYEREVKDGILTVYANLSEGTIKDIEDDEQVTVLALQVGTRGANGADTLITSDYAAVKKAVINGIVLSTIVEEPDVCSETEGTDHLWNTLQEAIDNEAQFEIEYNNAEGEDVAELIQSHYVVNGKHQVWDENANAGTVEKSGFKYRYDLIGYTEGANKTSQSAHAAMKGSFIRAQETANGVQQAWGASQSRATIGRMPIVRVTLEDTISGNYAAVGYIKFEIVSDKQEPEKGGFIEIPTFDQFHENFTASCHTEAFVFDLDWNDVEEQIYSTLDMSKEEFEADYELDGFVDGNPATPATQYDKTGMEASPVATDLGTVVRTTDDTEGSMTEVLRWTVTADEAYNQFVDKGAKSLSVIVRFVKENANNTKHYVYVTFKWTPAELNVTPQGEIDNECKLTNYWYEQASANGGLDEVHAHVAVPDGTITDDSKCIYEKDLLDFFRGNTITVDVAEPSVYEDFTDDKLVKTLKFIEPRVKMATGVSGDTYVLGVTSDGSALVAEKYVDASTKTDDYSDKVVVLNGTTVEYQTNATALDILNYKGRNDLADGETLAGRIGIEAVNGCGKKIELTNNTFEVRFIRPISVDRKDNEGLTDGLDNGDDIELAEFITFSDWRGFEFTTTNNYFVYYGVEAININVNNITTDLSGSDINTDKLTEVAPGIVITYVAPDADALSLNNMGTLTYKNNSGELREEFNISVPVEVTYKWGKVVVPMIITVHETI